LQQLKLPPRDPIHAKLSEPHLQLQAEREAVFTCAESHAMDWGAGSMKHASTAAARRVAEQALQQLKLPPGDPMHAKLCELQLQLQAEKDAISTCAEFQPVDRGTGKILRSFDRSSEYSFHAQLPWKLVSSGVQGQMLSQQPHRCSCSCMLSKAGVAARICSAVHCSPLRVICRA
jgi:hypothetical protein